MSDAATLGAGVSLPPRSVFPEREVVAESAAARVVAAATGFALCLPRPFAGGVGAGFPARCRAAEEGLQALDDNALVDRLRSLVPDLCRQGFRASRLAPAFALLSELAARSLGQRPRDAQLRAGLALLKGRVADLGPGEGKSLAAGLAAATAALAGFPVHVVAASDGQTLRAADRLAPFYAALGLSLGRVVEGQSEADRRTAYRCDITYCSSHELAFDHLRDRLRLGRQSGDLRLKLERLYNATPRCDGLFLRGLRFAILDDIDTILLDNVGATLAISRETEAETERCWAEEALEISAELDPARDFELQPQEARAELTEAGCARLAERAEAMGGIWRSRVRREDAASYALAALHLFRCDQHYAVEDGRIRFLDPVVQGFIEQRASGSGLQQLIEAKEGCRVSGRQMPEARTTVQRAFRRYHHLCGLTATGRQAGAALWSEYRLAPARTGPAGARRASPIRILAERAAQEEAIVARARALEAAGRPLLIATAGAASAAALALRLQEAGLAPLLLPGEPEETRLEQLAAAGRPGAVTVTGESGCYGGEIPLAPGVAEAGGLHVILAERQPAARRDRRILEAAGRRGAPGSGEAILCLEDPLLEPLQGGRLLRLAQGRGRLGQLFGRLAFRRAQSRREALEARHRQELVHSDRRLGEVLAFTGGME